MLAVGGLLDAGIRSLFKRRSTQFRWQPFIRQKAREMNSLNDKVYPYSTCADCRNFKMPKLVSESIG